ncbi:MAG: hypothetical protein CMH54_14885 [Myxococcales bacterium]|nr:hypothetical protein [Myxococcales bacterium]
MMRLVTNLFCPVFAVVFLCTIPGACGTTTGSKTYVPNSAPDCELDTILFEFNSYTLNHMRLNKLVNTARCINRMKRMVEVRGHCTQGSDEERNILIAKRRAESVRLSLIDLGVPETLLRLKSLGGSKPICTVDNDLCREQNNRVDLIFVTD